MDYVYFENKLLDLFKPFSLEKKEKKEVQEK